MTNLEDNAADILGKALRGLGLDAADQVANGQTQQIRLTPRSSDEIGDLAMKFNWMAERLNAVLQERDSSDARLRHAYADMENQVNLRTQELFALNQELIATNEQLQSTVASLNLTQASLVQAEKLAALGTLVSGVAHELNTPVGNCLTLSSHLCDSNDSLFADFQAGIIGTTVTFTPDVIDNTWSYQWDFGDGTGDWTPTTSHTYPGASVFQACLKVWTWDPLAQDTCFATSCQIIDLTGGDPCACAVLPDPFRSSSPVLTVTGGYL